MTDYIFTEDWFDFHIPVWNVVLKDLKDKPDIHMLEIGSFQGRSAVWLLENILTHETSSITCIDTFEGSVEHCDAQKKDMFDIFIHNVKGFGDKVTVYRGFSHHVLKQLKHEDKYDMIYVDGDHHASAALEDAVLSFRLLKKGGIMIFDDYLWEPHRPPLERPAPGINAFYAIFNDKIRLLHYHYQVIIEKLSD